MELLGASEDVSDVFVNQKLGLFNNESRVYWEMTEGRKLDRNNFN